MMSITTCGLCPSVHYRFSVLFLITGNSGTDPRHLKISKLINRPRGPVSIVFPLDSPFIGLPEEFPCVQDWITQDCLRQEQEDLEGDIWG